MNNLTPEQKTDAMKLIRDEIWKLKKSPLYKYRMENKYFPVIGEGSNDAKILFIGEAPGKNEALTGRPFCGRSGNLLDEMLASVGLNRADVYITNIVKDRPQDNRDPSKEEIELYSPFLDKQIDIIEPKVIATLGRFSGSYIMEKFGLTSLIKPISEIHGTEFTARSHYGTVIIIPLYHPAVALYNGGNKDILLKDFQILKKYK